MLPQRTSRLVKEEASPSYVYKDVPLPAPQEDELLVKVRKVALCGTDISLYQWNKGGCGSCNLPGWGSCSYSIKSQDMPFD